MKRVLVVEDEASIREMVALNLKMAGWEVVEAPSAERALELMHGGEPCDAALLDIMLPGMDGLSLCETIRRDDSDIGIIIVSAKGQESDKIRGLSIGADDYITKPFSVSELIARLEALTRRIHRGTSAAKPAEEPEQLVSGPFVLDEKSRILYKSGTPIDLTQVEFQIMELFFRNPATALVREKILEGVWGKNYFGDVKIVDVNIRRLRMKIEDDPGKKDAAGTFLNYYLPTTLKLLENYADFEEAGVSGENLSQAKSRIAATMDNIVAGFEHQLDELYRTDAMDVDSDIRVMETMLRRDTASAADDFGLGGAAVQRQSEEE